jgi:hypothetical protein
MSPDIENQLTKAGGGSPVVLTPLECPTSGHFAPGVYCREIFMPAGTFVVGHKHKTEHLNVILTGRARVLMNGVVREFAAPFTFKSYAGVRKVLFILEDCTWMTVHPTTETDLEKITEAIIDREASANIIDSQIKLLLEAKL